MDSEEFREHCLSKKSATEDMPFGEHTLVFRVGGKIFALLSLESIPARANLKCDPERALSLRDQHDEITPGYHMNKRHWNTLEFGALPSSFVAELIDHSYELVAPKGKPKKSNAR